MYIKPSNRNQRHEVLVGVYKRVMLYDTVDKHAVLLCTWSPSKVMDNMRCVAVAVRPVLIPLARKYSSSNGRSSTSEIPTPAI